MYKTMENLQTMQGKIMGFITGFLIIFIFQAFVLAQDNSASMDLEDLRRICYPGEYHRPSMLYISKEPDAIGSYLETMDCSSSSLHLSIHTYDGYPGNSSIQLDNLFRCNITEFWLTTVQGSQSSVIRYKRQTQIKLLHMTSLHLKLALVEGGDLISLIGDMPNLDLLELEGNRMLDKEYTSRILTALQGKPLRVLKLNGFQNPAGLKSKEMTQMFEPLEFFKTVRTSPLLCVEICDNYLTDLGHGFPDVLPQVRILNMSYNYLSAGGVTLLELLMNPVLEVVDFSNQGNLNSDGCPQPKRSYSEINQPLRLERRKRNGLYENSVDSGEDTACRNIKSWLVNKTGSPYLLNISCRVLPPLSELLALLDRSCSSGFKFPIGKNLKVINVDNLFTFGTQLQPRQDLQKICFRENNLTSYYFSHNSVYVSKTQYSSWLRTTEIVGLNQLNLVDLSYNGMFITLPNVLMLTTIPHLEKLLIQGNNISFNYSSGNSLCHAFPNLRVINLSDSNLSTVHGGLFSGCNGSLKLVDFQHNAMDDIFHISPTMDTFYIETFNLTQNKIKYISENTLDYLKHYNPPSGHKINFDLTGNEFLCDCSKKSLGTIELIKNADNHGVRFLNRESYLCLMTYQHTHEYELIMDVNLDEVQNICFPSHTHMYLLGTTILFVIATVVCIVTLIWKYRFRVVTKLYRIKLWILFKRGQNEGFKYDAFVAYCSADRLWVHNVLMKTLEETYGFLLCIHYRDFLAGEDICDEIVYHMSKSRCNIIVLSEIFQTKRWSKFELQRANTERLMKHKKMIVMKFGKINYQNASGLVKEILDCGAYMEWPQDESGKKSFETVQKRQELFLTKFASKLYEQKHFCRNLLACRHNREGMAQLDEPIDDDITPMMTIEHSME